MRALWGDNYYSVHSQKPGEAGGGLARDVRLVFTQLVRSGVPLAETRTPRHGRNLVEVVTGSEPPGRLLLSEDELQIYVRAFERTGFTGGINWYRNLDRNWETNTQLAGAKVEVPELMVTAAHEPVLRP